jgi:hypothetical protein
MVLAVCFLVWVGTLTTSGLSTSHWACVLSSDRNGLWTVPSEPAITSAHNYDRGGLLPDAGGTVEIYARKCELSTVCLLSLLCPQQRSHHLF